MVFLRLTVKVFPREHLPSDLSTDQDSGISAGVNGATSAKTTMFMLPVANPENITLGTLASLIQSKWSKIKPGAGPLVIKKLLDEQYPDTYLDTDLTVADAFVQHGPTNGLDQRGTVLVIQRHIENSPAFEREDSVMEDWTNTAATEGHFSSHRTKDMSRPGAKIFTIDENEPMGNGACNGTKTSVEVRISPPVQRDLSDDAIAKSVELENRSKTSDRLTPHHSLAESLSVEDNEVTEGSPARGREPSEELGAFPVSARRSPHGKQPIPDILEPSNGVHKRQNGPISEVQAVNSQQKDSMSRRDSTSKSRESRAPASEGNSKRDTVVNLVSDTDGDVEMVDSQDLELARKQNTPRLSSPKVVIDNSTNFKEKVLNDISVKRKRKSSTELPLAKDRRLELPSTPSSNKSLTVENKKSTLQVPVAPPLQQQKRPFSFSTPKKSLDLSDRPAHAPPGSMGLGITSSPALRQAAMAAEAELANLQQSASQPTADTPSKMRSAIRKSPLADHSDRRRSVSFADERPAANDKNKVNYISKFPSDVPLERIERYKREVEEEHRSKASSEKTEKSKDGAKRKSSTKDSTKKSKPSKPPKKVVSYDLSLDSSDDNAEPQVRKSSSFAAGESTPTSNKKGRTETRSTSTPTPARKISKMTSSESSTGSGSKQLHTELRAFGQGPPRKSPLTASAKQSPKSRVSAEPESDSDSDSDSEDIDAELFPSAGNGDKNGAKNKQDSIFKTQFASANNWTPLGLVRHTFASIREDRQREAREREEVASGVTNRKKTPNPPQKGKDVFDMTTSEGENSSNGSEGNDDVDYSSDNDGRGDILPTGKSATLRTYSKKR